MLQTEFLTSVTQSKSLFVILHGLGDSMEGYRWLPGEFNLPSVNYLFVNAPDDYHGGFSWYDFMGDAAKGIERSYQLLSQVLEVQRAEGFPTEQTVLFGFSQGCLMVLETGIRYPHLFAGLIGVSGYVNDLASLIKNASSIARKQRFLVTHGTRDTLLPMDRVRVQIQTLVQAGMNITWREFEKDHGIAGREEIELLRDFAVESWSGPKGEK